MRIGQYLDIDRTGNIQRKTTWSRICSIVTVPTKTKKETNKQKELLNMLIALLWWLVVGLVAGALAGFVMRGGGFGIVGDIIVGIVGAIIGGFLAGLLGLGTSNLIGSIIIAFIGACILIAILRLVAGRGSFRRRP
jgi:uncharacterized membrane protein YeaQ/YmgE (transglycosylase-associated protein family)